jgi:uncharacterized protein YjbI with pentapeptide repeats
MPTVTSASELLRLYALGERNFANSDLDRQAFDFDNCNLSGIDLSRSFIVATFRGATLFGANFSHANVKTCDFSDADLRHASFEGSAIDAATFDRAILDGAEFRDASAYGHVFLVGEHP